MSKWESNDIYIVFIAKMLANQIKSQNQISGNVSECKQTPSNAVPWNLAGT